MSNYPAGAENDPRAPYNQKDSETIEFDADVCVTLTRRLTLSSDDAYYEEWEDSERDEDGHIYRTGGRELVTDNVDFVEEYEKDYYSPKVLFEVLKKIMHDGSIMALNNRMTKFSIFSSDFTLKDAAEIIESCEGWAEDIEVEE